MSSTSGVAGHAGHAHGDHHHHELFPHDYPVDAHFGQATSGKIGMWIFLLSDAFSFGGLLLAYGILRGGAQIWHHPGEPSLGINFTAGLTFLGAGVRPPTPEWGGMISSGANLLILGQWWPSLFPGIAISITVFGFAIVGDRLEARFRA